MTPAERKVFKAMIAALQDCSNEFAAWFMCCSEKEIGDSFRGFRNAQNKALRAIIKAKELC